jgi:hypothetical protein
MRTSIAAGFHNALDYVMATPLQPNMPPRLLRSALQASSESVASAAPARIPTQAAIRSLDPQDVWTKG